MTEQSLFCRLGEVASVQGGFAFKSGDFIEAGVPVLKIKNVRLREVDTNELAFVDPLLAMQTSRYFCKTGDLLISMTGSGPQAPNSVVGRVARFTGPSDVYLFNQRVGRFVNKAPEKLDQRYLFYILSQEETLWKLVSIATGSANQANISSSQIESLEIPLPPLQRQRAISATLGTLDDKIELNRRMAATLEEMARAIFKSWFIDFDPVHAKAEGRSTGLPPEIDALFPASFEDSEIGDIPAGWHRGTIGDVCQNVKATAKVGSIDANIPYVGLEHIDKCTLALTRWGSGSDVQSQKSQFDAGDILFGKLRPYFHKVAIAPLAGICSTDILVVRAKTEHFRVFSSLACSEKATIDFVTACSDGTKMPRTNWSDLARVPIAIPDEVVATAFETYASSALTKIAESVFENKNLSDLRDSLLPKLICGELNG